MRSFIIVYLYYICMCIESSGEDRDKLPTIRRNNNEIAFNRSVYPAPMAFSPFPPAPLVYVITTVKV